ncbi:hypothetical protein C0995_011207, partial [Termitomyces sp. Mi166
MAFQGQPGISESSKSSGGGGGPRSPSQQHSVQLQGQIPQLHWLQGQQQMRIELDYEQRSYVKNLGVVQDKPRFYQAPEYSGGLGKGVAYRLPYIQDDLINEGCYEHSWQIRSYASAVMHAVLSARADYAQYMHPVDEALLQRLEWAGQPVPAMAAFLQDDLAMMVVEGLLNQIELLRRQRITALEQIERMGKCKAPTFKEPMVEPKQARAPSQCPQELVWAPASEPLAELSLEASDQIMSDASAVQQEQRSEAPQAPVASSSKAGASSQGGAQVVPELPALHAQPAANTSKMDVVNFPSNVPARAGPGQLLFLHAVAIPAPPPQLAVVVVTTDPRTPEQYNGLIATQQKAAAASKGKEKIVPMLSDKSDYGESLSMHEQKSEEGESVAQCFQHVQYNKKLAAKKVRKAKAEAALQHRAINDFSECIPNRLGVKVWGLLNVERLNLCFTGALSDCVYYSVHNNAIFIRANANWAAAFEYSA